MQRDMDLIRKVLLAMEAGGNFTDLNIEGYDQVQVNYHIWLLRDGGFIEGHELPFVAGVPQGYAVTLRWSGHDFLSAARSERIWVQVLNKAKTAGVSLTIGLLKEMLEKTIKGELRLH